jgi:hypothetical protein
VAIGLKAKEMSMRNIASILVVAAAASIVTLPLAHAADPSDSSQSSQNHVQQHQDAVPPSPSLNPESRRDQSAQAPQSPAVITPPSTGDKSVITPPSTGAAKTPVITPPGTTGNKDEILPK